MGFVAAGLDHLQELAARGTAQVVTPQALESLLSPG
jgi:hypothetical protein